MSGTYTSDGRRRSSMTHARISHTCEICGHVGFGNGAEASHGRAHVRRGEAVELLKEYASYPPMSSRVFLPLGDPQIVAYLARGFDEVR